MSIAVLGLVFYLLFRNRESDSVPPLLFKIAAAVSAAAFILMIDLLKAPETLNTKTNFLVLRSKDGDLLSLAPITTGLNLPMWNGYTLMENIWVTSSYKHEPKTFAGSNRAINEALTAAVMKWLANHYSFHWDMDWDYVSAISGGGGGGNSRESSDEKTAIYHFLDSSNDFLIQDRLSNQIKLPNGSSANLVESPSGAVFTVRNANMTLTIGIQSRVTGVVGPSILGKKINTRLATPGECYSDVYVLKIDARFSRLLRWSPETNKQKRWVKQMIANFERDFTWDSFKPGLQTALDEMPENMKLNFLMLNAVNEAAK